MRFVLYLRPVKDRQRLPFNYQYPLQAWLYRLLANADTDYATFLHERGYDVPDSHKSFKHFTFSALQISSIEPIRKGDDCMILRSPQISLVVSFYINQAAENFVMGLFQEQILSIFNHQYRAEFVVERVESLTTPAFERQMVLETAAPMVVAQKKEGLDHYLSPTDENFGPFFALNLIDKYRSIYPDKAPKMDANTANTLINFRLLSDPAHIKKRGFMVKEGKAAQQTKIIGYHNFRFELTAPTDIIEVGYWSGFGKYNTMGCGCVEVV